MLRLRSLSRVGSERPIPHFSQKRREMGHPAYTPARCFREKHAEPKAQDVIVTSLQDSLVAYLYPALTRWAGIFRSYGAEMREVGHSPAGCVRPALASEALGEKQERLGGAAGMGCGKTPGSKFPSTPRKSPHPFAKNAKELIG